jgi:AN1-type zinc finger and ubiquitin domain-containing protein 1
MVQKCEYCKIKKISTTFSFSCKCSYKSLCPDCRIPEKHACTFDYKAEGRKLLDTQNPRIIGVKLDKI